VPGVRNGATVYDEWAAYHAERNKTSPEMKTLGGGSDYVPFSFYCGIPSIDVWFRTDKNKYDITIYPSYHTGYETFYMVDTKVDPGFRIHQGCSRIALLTLKYFADAVIIPYSIARFPEEIKNALVSIKENGNGDKLLEIYDKFPLLEESIDNFTDVSTMFVQQLDGMKKDLDPVMIRAVNDLLMKVEQAFILPAGLPGRPDTRHAIFSPSQFDSYAASGFPGISDLLYKIDDLDYEENAQREKDIKRHISDLTILIQRATSLLKDFHLI
ncbi:Glutamate carboxypeptidase 2, partial [Halocaridina rubra]